MGDIFMGIFLLGAAVWDKRYHRIPNWWILFGGALGAILLVRERGIISILSFLLAAVIVMALFFPVFIFRMIGAGDIKVMAVICGYLGFSTGGLLIIYGFVLGAFFSAFLLITRGILVQRFSYFFAYFRQVFMTKRIIPYYLADRDGYEPTIHFAMCLCLGWGMDLIQRRFCL